MTCTTGAGALYNISRSKMLAGSFRWTDPDKALVAVAGYTFAETHRTLADCVIQASEATPMSGLFVSANGWAGSLPVLMAPQLWTQPIDGLIIVKFTGTIPATTPSLYELVAYLNTFLGGSIYPDGSPFSLTYDQSYSQQGWFRP